MTLPMLVLLGGFRGSRKRALAKELAKRRGSHWYDANQHAFPEIGLNAAKTSDVERMFIFTKVAENLPLLSKMYSWVIIDHSFHRRESREYLFAEAQKIFSQVVFIWVEPDAEQVHLRLESAILRNSVRAKEIGEERARAMREFESFSHPPTTFIPTQSISESAEQLWAIIDAKR